MTWNLWKSTELADVAAVVAPIPSKTKVSRLKEAWFHIRNFYAVKNSERRVKFLCCIYIYKCWICLCFCAVAEIGYRKWFSVVRDGSDDDIVGKVRVSSSLESLGLVSSTESSSTGWFLLS